MQSTILSGGGRCLPDRGTAKIAHHRVILVSGYLSRAYATSYYDDMMIGFCYYVLGEELFSFYT